MKLPTYKPLNKKQNWFFGLFTNNNTMIILFIMGIVFMFTIGLENHLRDDILPIETMQTEIMVYKSDRHNTVDVPTSNILNILIKQDLSILHAGDIVSYRDSLGFDYSFTIDYRRVMFSDGKILLCCSLNHIISVGEFENN